MRRKTTRRKTTPAKRRTTRRRRVSGIGKVNLNSLVMDVAGLVGGAVIARVGATMVLKQWPTASQMAIGAGQIAAGVLIPNLLKSKLGQDIGNGMIAFGGQVVLVNLGVISGVGAADGSTMSYRINGAGNLRSVSGAGQLRSVSGAGRLRSVSGTPLQEARQIYSGNKLKAMGDIY
jgi:hypothetical protein